MTGRLARGAPAYYAFVALVMGLMAALMVGCGGSNNKGGSAKFSIGGDFAAYTGRAIDGYIGSIKVTAQTGTDTPQTVEINRSSGRKEIDVASDRDYTFTVVGYHSENFTGPEVAHTSFVRRSPKRGNTENVTIDSLGGSGSSNVASVVVTLPATITCGSTVDISIEARNSSGGVILTSDDDSSFVTEVEPAGAGTISFNAGKTQFTATNDESLDGTTVRVSATLAGKTGDDTAVLDCEISSVFLKVHWNEDDRGLPGYANSARLTLRQGNDIVAEKTITRTSGNAYIADVDFGQKFADGQYDLFVEAFENGNGSGKVLADENFTINIDPGEGPITIDMSSGSFNVTGVKYTIVRDGSTVDPGAGDLVLFEGETVDVEVDAVNAAGELCFGGDSVVNDFNGPNVSQVDNNTVKATVRGTASSVTSRIGDVPGPFTRGIDVVVGSPGVIIIWDPPTRAGAPGYAKSAQAEIFDQNMVPIAGFEPICFNRPASGNSAIYWPDHLQPGTQYQIVVTLFPELDCVGNALMDANSGIQTVPADGSVSASTFDFPDQGNATNVETTVVRADGSIERYVDITPPPPGRRNGPLFLGSGESVTVTARATDSTANNTFFMVLDVSVDNNVTSFDPTTNKLTTNKLGKTFLTATAQPGRGPELTLEVRVMQPGVVAFSDFDDNAFGLGAVKSYLYVPTALVNSPDGDKIWEIPYVDSAYFGRPLFEPGVVLPTGVCNGWDVIQPAVNSRADRVALVIAPFDTTSGDVTYYKDLVVMDITYDANGAPVFGAVHQQNVQYDTADQICPQWGPQEDNNLDGVLYFCSMEFDRNTGAWLAGNKRDVFNRTNVDATPGPGFNMTSGISGNLLWPAIAPDNGEMAVIRKDGFSADASSTTGVGKIVTIDLSPFAPSGEQIDTTTSAASRIGYVASKGVQIPGSTDPATLINPDKYFIAITRTFNGGVTREVELLRAERTQAALGAFIVQQQLASDAFCAAVDGPDDFKVRNPRRVMCYLYNDSQIRAKNVTSPATGGIGTLITTLDPDLALTSIPSQPTFPAPFDVFDPLAR